MTDLLHGKKTDTDLPPTLKSRVEQIYQRVINHPLYLPPEKIMSTFLTVQLPPPPPEPQWKRVYRGRQTFRSEDLPPNAINPRPAEWYEESASWRDDERYFRYRYVGWEYELDVWENVIVNRDEIREWRENVNEWWKGLSTEERVALAAVAYHPCPECEHPTPSLCVVPHYFNLLDENYPVDHSICIYFPAEKSHQPVKYIIGDYPSYGEVIITTLYQSKKLREGTD